jgi:hypothetical protein
MSDVWDVLMSAAFFAGCVGLVCLLLRWMRPWLEAR